MRYVYTRFERVAAVAEPLGPEVNLAGDAEIPEDVGKVENTLLF